MRFQRLIGVMIFCFISGGLAQREYFMFDSRSGNARLGPDGSTPYDYEMSSSLGTVSISSGTVSIGTGATAPRGMQVWTVGTTGVYDIVAAGASGGESPQSGDTFGVGRGAVVSTSYTLNQGDKVIIAVGQRTTDTNGGGGGTFVSKFSSAGTSFANEGSHTLILVAGGGGAETYSYSTYCNTASHCQGVDADLSTSGTLARTYTTQTRASGGGGGGGCGLNGGSGGTDASGCSADKGGSAGGGGYKKKGGDAVTSPASELTLGGSSFLGGAAGGEGVATTQHGGFGCGGAGWNGGGSGGGYSGGQGAGASKRTGGGGGGSYDINGASNAATRYTSWVSESFGNSPSTFSAGFNTGNGFVFISTLTGCPAGQYKSGSSCINCPAGTFRATAGTTSVSACTSCPAMTFSSAGASQCTPCAANTGSGAGAPVCCANNQYLPAGAGTCQACPDNSRSSGVKCLANSGFFLLDDVPTIRLPMTTSVTANTGSSSGTVTKPEAATVTLSSNICDSGTSNNCRSAALVGGTTSDYLLVPNTYGAPMTVSFLMRASSVSTYYTVLGLRESESTTNLGFNIDLNIASLGGGITVYAALPSKWTSVSTAANQFLANTWIHVIVAFEDSGGSYKINIYLNGAPKGSGTPSSPSNFPGTTQFLFGAATDLIRGYSGYLADIRVYNSVFATTKAEALYTSYSTNAGTVPAGIACSNPPTACTATQTKRCPPTGAAGVCCSAGQFFIEGTHSACQACPAGTYTLDGAQTSCLKCAAANTYSTSATTATCTNCPADAGTDPSTGLCVATNTGTCPAGTYVSSSTCFVCPAGKFSATAGAASCMSCTANTGSSARAVGCVPNTGYYLASSATRFPSSAMTGDTQTIGGEDFATEASSRYDNGVAANIAYAYRAFAQNTAEWSSSTASFRGTGGAYNGASAYSTTVDGKIYNGEWLELRVSVARNLASYSITTQVHATHYQRGPKEFVIAGRNGNSPWTIIDPVRTVTWTSSGQTLDFTPSTSIYRLFDTFRLIALAVSASSDGYVAVSEWSLFSGSPAACSAGSCTTGTSSQCTTTGTTVCCGAGTYWVPSTTSAGCTQCPLGTFSADGSGTACTACTAGKFAGVTGLSVCQDCAVGTTSDLGGSICYTVTDCSAGLYKDAGVCTNCPAGTYRSATGATAVGDCLSCGTGTYSGAGSAACTNCLAGTFSASTNAQSVDTCQSCSAGTFSSAAQSSACTICAEGTFRATTGGTAQADCTDCSAGTYSTGGLSACTQCEAGTFSAVLKAVSSETCTSCALGRYATGLGMPNSLTCTLCADGKYGPTQRAVSSETQCLDCPSGTTSSALRDSCTVRGGYYFNQLGGVRFPSSGMTAENQNIGGISYSVSASSTDSSVVSPALNGFNAQTSDSWVSSDVPGYSDDSVTGYSYYAVTGDKKTPVRNPGSPATVTTRSGEWLQLQASSRLILGRYQIMPNIASDTAKRRAPRIWYMTGSHDGILWDIMNYVTDTSYVRDDAISNPKDFSWAGGTYCKAYNYYRIIVESVARISSGEKKQTEISELVLFQGTVDQCPAGKYSLSEATVCTDCPPGKYNPNAGASLLSACLTCADGSEPVSGQDSCSQCPTGKAGTGGTCSSCGTGTYSDSAGATVCTPCPAGTFSAATGASTPGTCIACGTGKYSITAGASTEGTCTSCAAGKFSDATGASQESVCATCPAGTYSGTAGASASSVCTSCGTGKYSGTAGASTEGTCTSCAPGKFSAATGASSETTCGLCAAGSFGATAGLSACSPCPANSKSAEGVSVCQANAGFYQGMDEMGTWVAGTTTVSTGALVAGRSLVFNRDLSTAIALTNSDPVTVSFSNGVLTATRSGVTIGSSSGYTQVSDNAGGRLIPHLWYKFDDDCPADSGSSGSNLVKGPSATGPVNDCYSTTSFRNFLTGITGAINARRGTKFFVPTPAAANRYAPRIPDSNFNPVNMQANTGISISFWGFVIAGSTKQGSFFNFATIGNLGSCNNNLVTSIFPHQTSADVISGTISNTNIPQFTATDHQWHHYTVIITTGNKLTIWRDGSKVMCPSGCTVNSPDVSLSAETRAGFAYQYYIGGIDTCGILGGAIDDFRVYSSALSDEASKELYYGSIQVYAPSASFTTCGVQATLCTTAAKPYLHCSRTGTPVCCGAGEFFVEGLDDTCRSCSSAYDSTYNSDGSGSTCESCAAGTIVSGGTCVDCTAGKYTATQGQTTCTLCDAGTYYTGTGANSKSTCTNCGAGTFSTASGAIEIATCALCRAGTFGTGVGLSASGQCSLCAAGTYSTASGIQADSDCLKCGTGTYSTASAAVAATTCELSAAGTYCTGEAIPSWVFCSFCSTGKYSTASGAPLETTCALCAAGTYATGSGLPTSAKCTLCGTGTYSTASGAIAATTCQQSVAGTYCTGVGAADITACPLCGEGTYSTALGGTAQDICKLSAAGTYCTGSGVPSSAACTLCDTGTYSTAAGAIQRTTCSLCAAGTFATGSGLASVAGCTLCSQGRYSTAEGAVQSATCSLCDAGTFATGSGLPESSRCTLCSTGTFSTASGAIADTTCQQSVAGTYCTGSGVKTSAECILCNTGTYSTALGTPVSSTCTLCVAGTYTTGSGLPSSSACTLCGTGTYSTNQGAIASTTCQLSAPGTYCTGTGAQSSAACILCNTGTYSTGSGSITSATCTLCVSGTYATGSGLPVSADCTLCQAGAYSTGSGMTPSSSCELCGTGKFSTASGAPLDSTCANCAAGTFSSGSGQTQSSTCATCETGTYATASASVCTQCPELSTTLAQGSTSFDACVCNEGLKGTPSTKCEGCPKNFYCSEGGQTPCPDGYFSLPASTSASACKCQPGATFVIGLGCTCNDGLSKVNAPGALGDRACNNCTANFYCSLDATTSCPANSQSPANSVVITDCRCDPGYYWDSPTQTCPICPKDSYCKNNQRTPCPTHTSTPSMGASRQVDCVCNPGFTCKVVRNVRVVIQFRLTAAEFTSREESIRAKIAQLAKVPVTNIVFQTSTTTLASGGTRRLLNDQWQGEHILDISAHIYGAAHGFELGAPIEF